MKPTKIRIFPDPVLRRKSEPVKDFGPSLQTAINLLKETLRSQPHGIGIAAPQIGLSKSLALVDVSARVPGARLIVLINPHILDLRQEKASREGCMSLPDYTGQIKRFDWIRFAYQDEAGCFVEREASGIEAVCIQHEVDHLNGVLFLDKVASLKRDLIPRLPDHLKA